MFNLRKLAIQTGPILAPQMQHVAQTNMIATRAFCYRWWKKHRDVFYPRDYNQLATKPGHKGKMGKVQYRTQDPLYIDERTIHLDGGVKAYIDKLHSGGDYYIAVRNMAFILYNMAKEGVRDKKIYIRFEQHYPYVKADKMAPREAWGGLVACYKQNIATLETIKFWKGHLDQLEWNLQAREIIEILDAFLQNEKLDNSHMCEVFDQFLTKRIMDIFEDQILYNQEIMLGLFQNLPKIGYFNEELYVTLINAVIEKKRIHKLQTFKAVFETLNSLNEDPKCTLYKKLDDKISEFVNKHYVDDFKWRYCTEKRRLRTHQELVERRNETNFDDHPFRVVNDDAERKERERLEKEKKLKNAYKDQEYFVKLVREMMAEGKSMIEMMVVFGVEEQRIIQAQSIISKEDQVKQLEAYRKKMQAEKAKGGDKKAKGGEK